MSLWQNGSRHQRRLNLVSGRRSSRKYEASALIGRRAPILGCWLGRYTINITQYSARFHYFFCSCPSVSWAQRFTTCPHISIVPFDAIRVTQLTVIKNTVDLHRAVTSTFAAKQAQGALDTRASDVNRLPCRGDPTAIEIVHRALLADIEVAWPATHQRALHIQHVGANATSPTKLSRGKRLQRMAQWANHRRAKLEYRETIAD